MTFEEKLRTLPAAEVWEEYCGFLEMTMEEYMGVQRRLLEEQIALLSGFSAKLPRKRWRNSARACRSQNTKTMQISSF